MKSLDALMQELCPDGVEFVKLGEVCKIERGVRVVKKELHEIGKVPVFQNSLTPLGYRDVSNCLGNTSFVISAGAAGEVGFSGVPFWAADDCLVVNCPPVLDNRYSYYFLKNQEDRLKSKVRRASVPRLSRKVVEDLEIPLPPISIQAEIVRILDTFTSLEAELEKELDTELDCRKRQYEYYRDKLLSFDNVGGQEVEWKKMSEVCLKTSKINWKLVEGEYKYIDLSSVDRDNHKISDCTIINKENAPSRAQQVVKTGDILFGTTRPTLMRFCYIPKEYDGEVCSTGYCVIRVNNEIINAHFAYHFLFTQKFIDYVEGHQKGASYPAISNKDVMSFELPIPSLQEQERIANILDRFESLTTSLQSGLPAEIAARRQQYAHYRDKLLTFRRKGAN